MKLDRFSLILSCILLCTLLFQTGCEEQVSRQDRLDPEWFNQPVWQQIRSSAAKPTAQQPAVKNTIQNNRVPKIKFQKMSHDFGQIRPGSANNVCEFVFTNTGNANLIISDIKSSCSCTLLKLENDKREYAPGESGKILAGYTDTQLGKIIKHLYISSNDPESPKTELAIQVDVVAPIELEPKTLNLSLVSANGGCPKIVVKSLDNKPFSITGFQSVGDTITVKYNPNEKATQFVLEPQVDMAKLGGIMDGRFEINLSHPDCEVVSGIFTTPPRFSSSPKMITIGQANPKEVVIKKINIVSNYDEDFSIQVFTSDSGVVKILDKQKTNNGYQVTVEINPPAYDEKNKSYTDIVEIDINGKENIVIPFNIYYPVAVISE